MNAPDTTIGAMIAHAVIDSDGILLSADPALDALNLRAGGMPGLPCALPQLANTAALAQRLGVPVCRRLTVADDEIDVELWVRAQPEGDRVRLAASGWTEAPTWRPAAGPKPHIHEGGLSWETDASLRLTYLSIVASRAMGLDPVSVLGRPLTVLFGFGEGADGAMPILDALARRRPFNNQPATLRPTSRPVTLSAVIRPDPMGSFAGLTGTARAVVADDEDDDVLRAAFTAGLDTALRSSLTGIVADADAIEVQRDGPISADYADYAADIGSAGRHLMSLIDDLIDLQAIERPDFTTAIEPIDLADIAGRTANLLSVRAEHAGVVIDRPPAEAVVPAMGDARRVLQIMVNLVGNALRYSPAGERVVIETSMGSQIAGITVTDRGKGIAPVDQERIFDKFERVDPTEAGGNGLGLFIARRLARAMGGDLTVASAAGEGARFTLTLPTRQASRDQ